MPDDLTSLGSLSPCQIKKQLKDFEKEIQDLFNLEARKQDIDNAIESIEGQLSALKTGIETQIENEIDYYEKGIQSGIDTIKEIPEYFENKAADLEKKLKDIDDQIRKPCDE